MGAFPVSRTIGLYTASTSQGLGEGTFRTSLRRDGERPIVISSDTSKTEASAMRKQNVAVAIAAGLHLRDWLERRTRDVTSVESAEINLALSELELSSRDRPMLVDDMPVEAAVARIQEAVGDRVAKLACGR